ncbi:MAG: UDP-3-O-(3-hydroxymyristoyl)glucosamine N-acyltransferase [Zetaproteobacteria bacterium]|nr:MAG: UDP-3-O-(3-hydroxymyristoyl)glucosamine N-acyltransferase [Zetaproteobacteria bacterium]
MPNAKPVAHGSGWRPTLAEVAAFVQGRLENADPNTRIVGIAPLEKASPEQISFLASPRWRKLLAQTQAAAVLVREEDAKGIPAIVVADPYLAYARLQQRFFPLPQARGARDASAVIDPSARLAPDVDVGAQAVVMAGAEIGAGTIIGAGCIVGRDVHIGRHCILHPRTVVMDGCVLGDRVIVQPGAVIGADGFGFAWSGERFEKIPQVGRVVIGNDVEIGANACIDRGALGDTIIEDGVKIDNLVQIGHNVRVGAHTAMAAQAGVSGSTRIGRGCLIGGQAGFAGHLTVADRARIGAQAGVIGDIKAPGEYWGTPAAPKRQWLKAIGILMRLQDLWPLIKKWARLQTEEG